jgi:hypothetical protein
MTPTPTKPALPEREVDRFHAHLDQCRQCRDNPFKLCCVGIMLMEQIKAALAAAEKEL